MAMNRTMPKETEESIIKVNHGIIRFIDRFRKDLSDDMIADLTDVHRNLQPALNEACSVANMD